MKAWGVAYRVACGLNTAGCLSGTVEMLKKVCFFRSRRKIREVLGKNALCGIAHVFAHVFEKLLTLLTFLLTLKIWRCRNFFVTSAQEAGRLSVGTDVPADNLKNINVMMKRKFFAPLMGAVVLGLTAYAGYRTYDAYNVAGESDLLLANAEALADGEGHGERIKCYSSIHYELGSFVVECSTCERVEDRTDNLLCFHDYCYR